MPTRGKKSDKQDLVNILLIEDNREDFEFIKKLIHGQTMPEFHLIHVDRLGSGLSF